MIKLICTQDGKIFKGGKDPFGTHKAGEEFNVKTEKQAVKLCDEQRLAMRAPVKVEAPAQ